MYSDTYVNLGFDNEPYFLNSQITPTDISDIHHLQSSTEGFHQTCLNILSCCLCSGKAKGSHEVSTEIAGEKAASQVHFSNNSDTGNELKLLKLRSINNEIHLVQTSLGTNKSDAQGEKLQLTGYSNGGYVPDSSQNVLSTDTIIINSKEASLGADRSQLKEKDVDWSWMEEFQHEASGTVSEIKSSQSYKS